MSNICYTKYKIEGPKKEIMRLYNHLRKMIALKPTLKANYEKMEQHLKQSGLSEGKGKNYQKSLYYHHEAMEERYLSRQFDKYGATYDLLMGHCTIVSPVTRSCLKPLNGGWLVLSLEASSQWTPDFSTWDCLLEDLAPHAHYIYYTEEFWSGLVETNDVWGKYFDWEYAVCAHIPEKTPQKIKNVFMNAKFPNMHLFWTAKTEYREREDQYKEYFSYWPRRELRGALRKLVPQEMLPFSVERLYTSELIEYFYKWLNRKIDVRGLYINIRKVKHVETPKQHPCSHCERLLNVEHKLNQAQDKIEKMQRLIRYCFYTRHERR